MVRAGKLLSATAIAVAVFGLVPAQGAPTGTKITVYQTPCAAETCGAHDRILTSGAIASGTLQIQASSSSTVGFDRIRLEALTPSGTWDCLAAWVPSSTSFWAAVDWDTTTWPACSGSSVAGRLTGNDVISVRLDAHEKVGDGQTITQPFQLKIDNAGRAPVWASTPSASGTEDRAPSVELRWRANPEPDVLEYHFLRRDPDGSLSQYAVSASEPGGQGCERAGNDYVCSDDVFDPDRFEGTYSYALYALRSSQSHGTSCSLGSRPACIASAPSESVSVKLAEPAAPPPAPQPSTQASSPARPPASHPTQVLGYNYQKDYGALPGYEGAPYDSTLPYQSTLPFPQVQGSPESLPLPDDSAATLLAGGADAGAGDPSSSRKPLQAAAGGLVLLMVGIHLSLLLRRPVF